MNRKGMIVSYSMQEPDWPPVCECKYDEVQDRVDREDCLLHGDMEDEILLPEVLPAERNSVAGATRCPGPRLDHLIVGSGWRTGAVYRGSSFLLCLDSAAWTTAGAKLCRKGSFYEVQGIRHAAEEMMRRGIPHGWLELVLGDPQQRLPQPGGTEIFQSQLKDDHGRIYLLRVVVAVDEEPPVVVTVYRTSKIEKYWRPE